MAREPRLAALAGVVKAGLYVERKWRFGSEDRPIRAALTVIRVGLGLVAPFTLWTIDGAGFDAAAVALALAGEAIDRCEYYLELERESPRRQMDLALKQRVTRQTRRDPTYTDGPWRPTSNATGSPA